MARTKIFETKKINMETLPEYLKATRESFSYDLKHVGKITNISDKFLVALEEGYYHRLPADVYVYGFLRKIAELYRTDADLLISQYKKERGIHENINKIASRPMYQISSEPSKFVLTPKTIAAGLFALLIVSVLGYIIYQVHLIGKPPAITVFSPADGSVISDSSIVIRGQTDQGVNLTLDGQKVSVDSSGNFSQPISVSEGPKVLTLVAVNSFGKQSTRQFSIIGDLPQSQTQPQQQNFSLTVQAHPNPTVLTIQIDDNQQSQVALSPGQSQTFTAKNKIMISTADAGSTYVQINGGQPFKLGKEGQSLSGISFLPPASPNSPASTSPAASSN